MKKQNGITLIALVITIIILLILAGITLAIVFNGGIIDKSQNAVDSYNYSSKNEDAKLADLEAKFTQLYNERVAGKEGGSGEGSGGASGTIGTLVSNVHVGDYIEYNPTLGVTDTSLLSYESKVGTLEVKDSNQNYVLKETGTNTPEYNGAYNLLDEDGNFVTTGYTAYEPEVGNGYGNQIFTATSSNNVWRVLDVNMSTGVVKIIPENEIKTTTNANFYMKGLRGYKNAVTELNNISSIFGHGTGANGAQSITVEEVNALTGYTPDTVSSVTVTGSLNKAWYNTYYTYSGTTKPGTSGQNSNGIDNAKIHEMLMRRRERDNRKYWLASSYVHSYRIYADFGVRFINGELVWYYGMWLVNSEGEESLYDDYGAGVCPVVTLQSSVNYKSGDGTSSASDKIIKFQ